MVVEGGWKGDAFRLLLAAAHITEVEVVDDKRDYESHERTKDQCDHNLKPPENRAR